MMPWLGRKKKLRVFIPGKPHPNGIKICVLADEYNYVYNFWIYHGEQLIVADIVTNFVDELPGMHHNVAICD